MIVHKTNSGNIPFIIQERFFDILYKDALKKSYNYVKKYANSAVFMENSWWDFSLNKIKTKGLCLEFGVFKGTSINYFSNYLSNRKWYGFDSFFGLQEDWKGGWFGENHFSLNGVLPEVNKNVKLIKGWFKETLPIFLKKNNDNISFIHIDCDTYESTFDVFKFIKKEKLQKGCILLFDEYLGCINWENNEFKAWQEYVKINKINYKYLGFGERQAIIEII